MVTIKRCKRGQSTAEYAVVIALVLGAVVGMQTYVRRAINARVADASDNLLPDTREDATAGTRSFQFEPDYAKSDFTTTSKMGSIASDAAAVSERTMKVDAATGISGVTGDYESKTNRNGSQTECGAGKAC